MLGAMWLLLTQERMDNTSTSMTFWGLRRDPKEELQLVLTPHLRGITTPLQLNVWKHRLCYHSDQDFVHYILPGTFILVMIYRYPLSLLSRICHQQWSTPQSLTTTSRKKLTHQTSSANSPQHLPQQSTSIILVLYNPKKHQPGNGIL